MQFDSFVSFFFNLLNLFQKKKKIKIFYYSYLNAKIPQIYQFPLRMWGWGWGRERNKIKTTKTNKSSGNFEGKI